MFVNCCLIVSYGLLWKAKGRKNDGNYIQLDPEPLDLLILSTCLFTRVKKYIIAKMIVWPSTKILMDTCISSQRLHFFKISLKAFGNHFCPFFREVMT